MAVAPGCYFVTPCTCMLCLVLTDPNTPGAAGGPGDRGRTLAVKSQKIAKKSVFFVKKYIFWDISSSYAKILGEKLFRTWEIPRSG